ncbi:GtrA family protein [Raineyella sp. W15-4]|uniref:GtrA family protein n=1 Tax=Raineyella sp. W15-4 TaxID=3081651 RepID=UPI002952BE21|nr:GtrA family protein [Raineyella sp. W15-4]WOQ15457.1 GtrA family protein [Raineyella sp. W15-4]
MEILTFASISGSVPPMSEMQPPDPSGAHRFLRFGVVGGLGTVLNVALTIVMTKVHGGVIHDNDVVVDLPGQWDVRFTAVVWIVCFLVANVFNYGINRRWTFAERAPEQWTSGLGKFLAVGVVAAILGLAVKILLTNPTSPMVLPDPPFDNTSGLRARAYWAQVIAIGATMPVNYLLNLVWTFRRGSSPARAEPSGHDSSGSRAISGELTRD